MPDPESIRQTRWQKEFELLEAIRCDAIQWSSHGNPPLTISVTYNIRSIVAPTDDLSMEPKYRDIHHFIMEIPSGFPFQEVSMRMKDEVEPIYHPNFWPSGLVCIRGADVAWDPGESLANIIVRVGMMLQFDPHFTQESHRANSEAADWYTKYKNSGLFPTDHQALPAPGFGNDRDFEIEDDFVILGVK